MSVEVLDTAREMINQLRNREDAQPDCPDYLFDILSGRSKNVWMKEGTGNISPLFANSIIV